MMAARRENRQDLCFASRQDLSVVPVSAGACAAAGNWALRLSWLSLARGRDPAWATTSLAQSELTRSLRVALATSPARREATPDLALPESAVAFRAAAEVAGGPAAERISGASQGERSSEARSAPQPDPGRGAGTSRRILPARKAQPHATSTPDPGRGAGTLRVAARAHGEGVELGRGL